MYCTNCGRPTNGESTLCSSCVAIMRATGNNKVTVPATEFTNLPLDANSPRANEEQHETSSNASGAKLGFGGALASLIISNVGAYLAAIFFVLSLFTPIVARVLSVLIALPMFVVSLILGIKSIKCFKNATGKKPVATLILGIAGVVSSASIIILVLFTMFFAELIAYYTSLLL